MIFDEELPYWSEPHRLWVMRESPEWIVSVVPMLVNDRITLVRPEHFETGFTAGFCYDKSPGCYKAMVAAMTWQIGVRRYPEGLKKIAIDSRPIDPDFKPDEEQVLCWLCLRERGERSGLFANPRLCAGCGTTKDEGRIVPFDHTMRYAQGGYRLTLEEACP